MVMLFLLENNADLLGDQLQRENSILFVIVLLGIPVLLYYPVMEILTNGQTVGKKIMGITGDQLEVDSFDKSVLLRWMSEPLISQHGFF